MKKKNKGLRWTLCIIVLLTLISAFGSLSVHSTINTIISTGLLISIVAGVYFLIKGIKSTTDKSPLPYLSKEKEQHYLDAGMSQQEITFFRDTMSEARKNIYTLDRNMTTFTKLKAINFRFDTTKAAKAMFKEIVKEPQKLHHADRFLYHHLPNIVELTNKYAEISQHDLKNKRTYEALNHSVLAIEEASTLILHDYEAFVADDLDDLNVEISIAKQNMIRESELTNHNNEKGNQ